jgi:ELWxxDGT repeat protein
MSAVSRWHTGSVLGLMFVLGCTQADPGEETPLATRASPQALTSFAPAVTLDINPATASSAPESLLVVDGKVFFTADDGVSGRELYVSDGTAEGTRRVADIFPGPGGSTPMGLATLGDHVYFFAQSGVAGSTSGSWFLWKSDGTEAGTVKVRELPGNIWNRQLVRSGNALYFSGFDSATGDELWRTDGTSQGTVRVKDIRPGNASAYPSGFVDVNGTVYFSIFVENGRNDLWKSDGTEAGTVRVSDFAVSDGGFSFVGGSLYLFRSVQGPEGAFTELWRSDGTEAGQSRIKQLWASGTFNVPWSTAVGSRLYFFRSNGDLWTSDGTEAGTRILKSFRGRAPATFAYAALGSRLYFAVDDGTLGLELWSTDGTEAGTVLAADVQPGAAGSAPTNLVSMGGALYFSAREGTRGRELWRTNGVDVQPVRDIAPGVFDSAPERTVLAASGQRLFFRATDGAHGNELWTSDGTTEGTTLLKDLATLPASSGVTGFTRVGDKAFFVADDGLSGAEVWVTDGTPEGTRMVLDSIPGAQSGTPQHLTEYRGALYFVIRNADFRQEFWKTDGTPAGTMSLNAPASGSLENLKELNGSLLFMGGIGEFWKTDGTQAGTVRYETTDQLGVSLVSGSESRPVLLNGALHVVAGTRGDGVELWRADGTANGTSLLKDINPGSASSYPRNLRGASNSFYFTVPETPSQQPSGVSTALWRSDGTGAGTTRVGLINETTSQPGLDQLTTLGDAAVFVQHVRGQRPSLWKTDGTAQGMVRLYEPPPDAYLPLVELTTVGSQVFFVTSGPTGRELWRTDGTPEGTREVKDIRPQSQTGLEAGTPPTALTAVDGLLYFAVNDGVSGEELWRSDGTAEGTVRVADLVPGGGSSNPRAFTPFGGGLLVVARDEAAGAEPRVLVPSSVTCPIVPRQEATSPAGASVTYAALLADGLPASTPIQYSHPAGSVFPLGSTEVQATAQAPGYRVTRCTFIVTVSDTTAPALDCPAGKVVQATDAHGATVEYSPAQVTDSVSTPEVTYSHPSGSRFLTGRTQVDVTATDAAGNTATCNFAITVQSNVSPPPTEGQDDSGCGCGAGSPALAWWLLAMLVPAVRRRGRAASRD